MISIDAICYEQAHLRFKLYFIFKTFKLCFYVRAYVIEHKFCFDLIHIFNWEGISWSRKKAPILDKTLILIILRYFGMCFALMRRSNRNYVRVSKLTECLDTYCAWFDQCVSLDKSGIFASKGVHNQFLKEI